MIKTIKLSPRGNLPQSTCTKRTYSTSTSFSAKDLVIEKRKNLKIKPNPESLKFGVAMTDHMFAVEWHEKTGWGTPMIKPYGPLDLDPAAQSLHYAVQCFEGMKAYKNKEGNPLLFRPDENAKRMQSSSGRLMLPAFDANEFVECLIKFVDVERDWIPHKKDYSLYLRPTFIATTPQLGVSPSHDALLYIIASPVGPYYPSGFKPISLFASSVSIRAARGGTGNYKIGGNYGPTILETAKVVKKGHSQMLWLYENEITEVGTMNFWLFWINKNGEKELITAPEGDGLVLPGITRKSILEIARKYGEFKVSERKYTIQEFCEASKEGRVLEAFGCGTATVVSPVKGIEYDGEYYAIPTGENIGPLAQRFWNELVSIQYGEVESNWTINIDKRKPLKN